MEELLEQIRKIVASETQVRAADGGISSAADDDEPLLLSSAMVYRGEDDLSPMPSHRPAATPPSRAATAERREPQLGRDFADDPFHDPFAGQNSLRDSPAPKFDNLAMVDPFDLNLAPQRPSSAGNDLGMGSNSAPMENSRPLTLSKADGFSPEGLAQPMQPPPAPENGAEDIYDFSIKTPSFTDEASMGGGAFGLGSSGATMQNNSAHDRMDRLDDKTAEQMQSLLSPMVAERVRENFAKLDSSRAIPDPASRGSSFINDHARSQISVEELVLDCLKPAIKEWLDMNLNRIVELLVKDEISRVSPRRK